MFTLHSTLRPHIFVFLILIVCTYTRIICGEKYFASASADYVDSTRLEEMKQADENAQKLFQKIAQDPIDLDDITTFLKTEKNINVNIRHTFGWTLLEWGINHKKIAKNLLKRGALIQSGPMFGRTPLHHAVWNKDAAMVHLLLQERPLSIDMQDDYGDTAVHLAVFRGALESLRVLLAHDAKIIKNIYGQYPQNMHMSPDDNCRNLARKFHLLQDQI